MPSYLDEIDEALGETPLELRGDVDLAARRARLSPQVELPRVPAPPQLQATLRPYQQDGLTGCRTCGPTGRAGSWADDMGLGKTLQTIAHVMTEKAAGRLEQPALVVAPTSLVGNWRRELTKFAPSLRVLVLHGPRRRERFDRIADVDVVITTYPLVLRDIEVFARHRFYLQILDEAHTVKNVRSQIHQAVKAIDAELRLCITGTPLENNLDELWALFDFLMPGLLGSAERFRATFRYPIERMGNQDRLETLRKRVSPFILRRMKDTVAQDLPAKTEIVRTVELQGAQRDLYESIRLAAHAAVRKVVKKKGIAASTIDILGSSISGPREQPRRHFRLRDPARVPLTESARIYAIALSAMRLGYAASGDSSASDYLSWPRYNDMPYLSATHGNHYVNNYANAPAQDYGRFEQAGRLPPGSVVAKDSFAVTRSGGILLGPLFLMEKMPPGFSPVSGDWRYAMVLPSGELVGRTGGPNAHRVEYCIGCHLAREHTDHLFFIPNERRAGKK